MRPAGDEEVQRFHAEAEAAANLDHPGIVPIYEIQSIPQRMQGTVWVFTRGRSGDGLASSGCNFNANSESHSCKDYTSGDHHWA